MPIIANIRTNYSLFLLNKLLSLLKNTLQARPATNEENPENKIVMVSKIRDCNINMYESLYWKQDKWNGMIKIYLSLYCSNEWG